MCLAVPGRILRIDEAGEAMPMGTVSFGGIEKRVCLSCVPEARVGEYVLVHVGFALQTVDEEEALKTLEILREMDELSEIAGSPDAEAP